MRINELAAALDLPFEGDGTREVTGVASLEEATNRDISFTGSRKTEPVAQASSAGAVVAPASYLPPAGQAVIRASNPRAGFARAIRILHPASPVVAGIHPSAVIHPDARIHSTAEIGPFVSIGAGTQIGAETRIGAGSSIADNVTIGERCNFYPRVTVYDKTSIGNRAILHSGCVIGADGFGFAFTEGKYQKFPQVGRVVIGDDVEIGANSCVDRAALGATVVGDGAKLDNMVHIAHNCRLGRHVVIAAQTGFAGGVIVEDYAVIGGQVGVGERARIESGAVLGSGAGVLSAKVVRKGEVQWGTPARPLRKYLEQLANLSRLPALRNEVDKLKQRLDDMKAG